VPAPIVVDAMNKLAADTTEFGIDVGVPVDLARRTVLGNTPSKTWNGLNGGFGAELVIPSSSQYLMSA
jgi:hypothetical protein